MSLCGYFLDNFGGKLGHFLFHHLVTLHATYIYMYIRVPTYILCISISTYLTDVHIDLPKWFVCELLKLLSRVSFNKGVL